MNFEEYDHSPFTFIDQTFYLKGTGCLKCNHISFPYRPVCPNCLENEVTSRTIGQYARLLMWTVSHTVPEGYSSPLIQSWVKTEEGPELFSLLFCSQQEKDNLKKGQLLKLDWKQRSKQIEWGYYPIQVQGDENEK